VFRGEFVGTLGGTLSAQGLDRRLLVKEFTGKLALQLARYELLSIGRLQSDLIADKEDAKNGWWVKTASARYAMTRQDNEHVLALERKLSGAPFLGILGEVNLAELEDDMDPNEFYRALGVPPPKPEAVWVVYEYVGLNTVQSYAAVPAEIRRSRLPVQKTFFGGVKEPPPLPPWKDRANYVVKGIMKGALQAVATIHEGGIAHRSIGRSSILLTSVTQDKREASTVYATRLAGLVVKLSDFGFSGLLEESTYDDDFCGRARSFGLYFRKGDNSLAATNFAMAEDLHALGFVFLGLLLSTLAQLPRLNYPIPNTDEDTLQRLLGDIFDKDIQQFREYVEAEDVWSKLVELLDESNGAGWNLLELLFKAREIAAENKNSLQTLTARSLLDNPIFQS
jgi:serine/threonine protein kinase